MALLLLPSPSVLAWILGYARTAMLWSRESHQVRADVKLSLGHISSVWLISLPALDQCQEILISCSSWPWRAVLGTVICSAAGGGPAQALAGCAQLPPAVSDVAGLEQGKAVLRAWGPLRELLGLFGLSPSGNIMLVGGGATTLLHCPGHHPAPHGQALLCCQEPFSAKCCPQSQLQHWWRLSPVCPGCAGTRPAMVQGLISGFGFCSAVGIMENCWAEE